MGMTDEIKNYQQWKTIERDGTTKDKLMLSLQDKRKREEIIDYHFKKFYKETYGVELPSSLIERDNPHDFTFANAAEEKFYLEIVAVSDTHEGFRKHRHHAKLDALLKNEPMSVFGFIPWNATNKDIEKAVLEMEKEPPVNDMASSSMQILNQSIIAQKPIIRKTTDLIKLRLFMTDGVNVPLEKIVTAEIKKKEAKQYKYVKDMTLIVDDQIIMYNREDIARSWFDLVLANQKSTFKEIFLYSGYYANENGNNAQFTIWPIKCERERYTNPRSEI